MSPTEQRRVLVVGATTGIGLTTAEGLMQRGAEVVLGCRTPERGHLAVESLLKKTGRTAELLVVDLQSPNSIRAAATECLSRFSCLHVLIHNAGVVFPRRTLNAEGWEAQMAVIYLGPFLLTQLLEPLLLESPPARVINVVSELHHGARLNLNDFHSQTGYDFLACYRRAELAKILWTYELARRWKGRGVTANCVHPGGVRTQLFRHLRGPLGWLFWLSNLLKKGPRAGARGSLHLAWEPGLENVTGEYFVGTRPRKSSPPTYDLELAQRLWERSLQEVGLDS